MISDILLEIFGEFMKQPFGNSLTIKGKPGAGKTTFALELLDWLKEKAPVYYVGTRSSNDPLREKFPWISDVSSGSKVRRRNKDALNEVVKENLNKLERMIEEGKVSKSYAFGGEPGLVLNIEEILPELESMYNFVGENIDKGPVVVLDSIEALAEKYDLDPSLLFSIIQKDLAEKSGANLILIQESDQPSPLDYYSDGVVQMNYSMDNNFLIRDVTILKLRGVSIGSSPTYLYSLENGRFHSFRRDMITYPNQRVRNVRKADERQFEVSLGSQELSKVLPTLSDKVPLGSVVMFHRETKSNMVDSYVNALKNSLIKYNVSNGRGVIDISSSSYESSKIFVNTMDPEWLKNYITAERTDKTSPFVINIGGRTMIEDFPKEVLDYYLTHSKKPYTYVFSTDFLRFTYGESFFGDLSTIINGVRPTGIIVIIADDEEYKKIYHYASFTVHVHDINGYVMINSNAVNHFVTSVGLDDEKWPELKFSIIV